VRLHLSIRTPGGVLFDGPVVRVRAEDASGWFGLRPGREDVVAVLPPGLLLFQDEEGEGFVALSSGLLSLEGGLCRVTAREAVLSRSLEDVAERLEALQRLRSQQARTHRDVLHQLAREALRRMVREART
jgi:F-type H+-transporting ATPase subunit epsilon